MGLGWLARMPHLKEMLLVLMRKKIINLLTVVAGLMASNSNAWAADAAGPTLSIKRQDNNVVLSWPGTATLQSADEVTGSWADVAGAPAQGSATITPSERRKFYRLKSTPPPTSALVFQDDFQSIPEGEADPAWLTLTGGPWVVQGGQYISQMGGQIWEWNVVKDLVVGDLIFSADMIVPGPGIIVRVQNPTEGENPTCLVVLFEHYGIDVYRVRDTAFDYVGPWKGSPPERKRLWSDITPREVNVYNIQGHRNEWAHLTVSMIGDKLSASASLINNPSITAEVAEIAVGIEPDGSIGLYRSNTGSFPKFDNVAVYAPLTGLVTATGTVTDSRTAGAVAGATVEVVGAGHSTTANASGEYTLMNVSPGSNFLRISAGGYVTKQIAVNLIDEMNTVNVAMDPYQSIGAAKALGPGVSVGMIGVVTAVFGERFVIESEDRSAGMTVTPVNPGDLAIGEEVRVAGSIQSDGRLLASGAAERTGRSNVDIQPVSVNNRDIDAHTDLLVVTSGRVLAPPVTLGDGTTLIHITDGSAGSAGRTVGVPGEIGTAFQDDFNAIADGQPDPAWLPLTGGPWIVQSGEYLSENPSGNEWSIIKDLVMGDFVYSADMIVPDTGLILRVQNPAVGQNPDQRVLVEFDPFNSGIYVYRDYGPILKIGYWSDSLDHTGEWASLEVTMTGPKLSAIGKLKSDPSVTVEIPEITLPGIDPAGFLGLYRGNRFDNVKVTGNLSLSLDANTVQLVIPASVTGTPAIAEGDNVRAAGIVGKGLAFSGVIRGVTIRKPDDLSIIAP